jgi:hypothetical protein
MILTGENPSTWRGGEPCPSATLYTTNFRWTCVGSNPNLYTEGLVVEEMARLLELFENGVLEDVWT